MNQVEADERFVLQIFRLFRQAVLHDLKNDAVTNTIRHSVGILQELIRKQHFRLSMVFWGENVFINGHALRAVRSVYKSAVELGAELTRLGINEIIVESGVNEKDLHGMLAHYNSLRQLAIQNEGQASGAHPVAPRGTADFRPGPNIIMRYIDASLLMGYDERSLGQVERVVRTCTSAAVVLERLHEQLREGRYDLVRFVKRVARNLVQLTEEHPHLLLTFFRVAPQRVDPAHLSLKTAVLAITTSQELEMDLRQRTNLAMTALLFDVGIIRACGLSKQASREGLDFMPTLHEDGALRMPAASAAMMAIFGNLNRPSLARSVFVYEGHHLSNTTPLDFPYEGKIIPTVEGVILATCRTFVNGRAGRTEEEEPLSPSDAITLIRKRATTNLQKYILDLFVNSVTLFERGTPVKLTSGAVGCIVKNGDPGTGRPVIRLAYRSDGTPEPSNQTVDLSKTTPEILKLGRVQQVVRKPDDALKTLRNQINRKENGNALPQIENRDGELYVSGPLYPTLSERPNMPHRAPQPAPVHPEPTDAPKHGVVPAKPSKKTQPPPTEVLEDTSDGDDSIDELDARTEQLEGVDANWKAPDPLYSDGTSALAGPAAPERRTTPIHLDSAKEQTLDGRPTDSSSDS